MTIEILITFSFQLFFFLIRTFLNMTNESTSPTQRPSTPSPNTVPTDFTTIAGFTVFLLLIVFIIIGCLVLVLASKKGCCRRSNQSSRENTTEVDSTSVNLSEGPPSYLEVTENNRNSTEDVNNQNRIFFCEVPPPSYSEVMEALAQKKKEEEDRNRETDPEGGNAIESRSEEEVSFPANENSQPLSITINQSDINSITQDQVQERISADNDHSPTNTVYTWAL